MLGGLSVRSKQSGKELGEIARMTETCLLSDRHSLSVTAGPTLTSANVHTQLLKWLFERRNSLLQSERQQRGKERHESGCKAWARREHGPAACCTFWAICTNAPPSSPSYFPSLHSPDLSTTTSPFPPPPVFPFKRNSFNSICLFPTFTRTQYHFH